jgi:glycosyltransferase involved in cell wall biosynthesis
VSDLWPESAEKLGIVTNKWMLKFAYNLERRCYERATLVTGQTMGIVDDIMKRFPKKEVYWLPNGVDPSFYDPSNFEGGDFRQRNNFKSEDLLFFYGGILGHAQGLEVILHAAQQLRDKTHIQFVLQGAGPEKDKLTQLKKELQLNNVHFLDPVSKKEMPDILKSVDVALVPLKNLPLFQGAIPSKIFEALAMKKPLLLGVDGEARMHFVDRAHAGLFFLPENVSDLVKQITKMDENKESIAQMGERAREYVCEYFDRDKIASAFLSKLQNI